MYLKYLVALIVKAFWKIVWLIRNYFSKIFNFNVNSFLKFISKFSLYNGFGTSHTWSTYNNYPRFIADVDGDGFGDIVGFANAGIDVSWGKIDNY